MLIIIKALILGLVVTLPLGLEASTQACDGWFRAGSTDANFRKIQGRLIQHLKITQPDQTIRAMIHMTSLSNSVLTGRRFLELIEELARQKMAFSPYAEYDKNLKYGSFGVEIKKDHLFKILAENPYIKAATEFVEPIPQVALPFGGHHQIYVADVGLDFTRGPEGQIIYPRFELRYAKDTPAALFLDALANVGRYQSLESKHLQAVYNLEPEVNRTQFWLKFLKAARPSLGTDLYAISASPNLKTDQLKLLQTFDSELHLKIMLTRYLEHFKLSFSADTELARSIEDLEQEKQLLLNDFRRIIRAALDNARRSQI